MSFAEGHAALSMSNNGYDVLDILLGKVHPNLKDKWSCEEEIPKYSDHQNLIDYCNAIKSYLDREWLSGQDHTEPKKSRKFLAFLDHPMFEPVVNDLKKMINQQ